MKQPDMIFQEMKAIATLLHKTLLVQVDKTTKHRLGLLICQWVKNQQGGAFKIENENNCQLPGKASKWRGQNIYMYKVPMLLEGTSRYSTNHIWFYIWIVGGHV